MQLRTRVGLLFGMPAAIAVLGVAQSGDEPRPLFEYATFTGSGNTMRASRVPVIVGPGRIVFRDLMMRWNADGDGSLTLTEDSPQVNDTPDLPGTSFRPGKYRGPLTVGNGKALIIVDGPGISAGGGREWSMVTAPDSDPCAYPISATWHEGPIENSPLSPRLERARITSRNWSYGVGGGRPDSSCSGSQARWDTGVLVGVGQTGNSITIATFTSCSGCADNGAPIGQITYRLEQ